MANIHDEHARKLAETDLYYERLFAKHAGNAEMLAELEIAKNDKIADINEQHRQNELDKEQEKLGKIKEFYKNFTSTIFEILTMFGLNVLAKVLYFSNNSLLSNPSCFRKEVI